MKIKGWAIGVVAVIVIVGVIGVALTLDWVVYGAWVALVLFFRYLRWRWHDTIARIGRVR